MNVITSCHNTKKISNTSKTNSKELSEQNQLAFAASFVDGCNERMKANIEKAENLFKDCLKIDPSSSAVKYELGNIYKYIGIYDLALKFSKECANEDAKNEWYQLLYIDCLHSTKQYAQAAEVYARLVKNFPLRSDFHEGLAAEYMYAGNYEKSYKTFDELEKKYGQNDAFTLNKIKLLKQLKKNNEVEVEFKKLINNNPDEVKYYGYLAEFYIEINQPEKAFLTYNEALTKDSTNPYIHLALGDYYKAQKNELKFYEEIKTAFENPDLEIENKMKILETFAQLSESDISYKNKTTELCQIALKLHPLFPDIHTFYGDLLFKNQKLKEAKDQYKIALQIDKSKFSVWGQLMYVESELQDNYSLDTTSNQAIDLFPNNPIPYYFNAIANMQLLNYDVAIKSLEDGIEFIYDNKPLLIEFLSNLGNIYNDKKEYGKSDKAYDDALKVDPDNASVLNNYAYFLSLRKEHLDKAEKYSRRSNEISPNNRSYIDTYGWILFQLAKYKEAEIWLSRAVKMGNKNAVLLEHYGDVLYKLDKKEDALNYWREAKLSGKGSEFLDKKIEEKKLND